MRVIFAPEARDEFVEAEREGGEIRRLILTRFPHKLLYTIELDHLYVLAVAHLHRKPNYWVGRSR